MQYNANNSGTIGFNNILFPGHCRWLGCARWNINVSVEVLKCQVLQLCFTGDCCVPYECRLLHYVGKITRHIFSNKPLFQSIRSEEIYLHIWSCRQPTMWCYFKPSWFLWWVLHIASYFVGCIIYLLSSIWLKYKYYSWGINISCYPAKYKLSWSWQSH